MVDERASEEILRRAGRISLVLTDVDGVLTDGGVYYSGRGEETKRFSMRDGMGVERLRREAGIETGIITGEDSPIVSRRAEKLSITELHLGIGDKDRVLREILDRRMLAAEQVAYIGDDVNDLPAFAQVGLTAAPADAMEAVLTAADYVCACAGGHGAFRELAELIIRARSLRTDRQSSTREAGAVRPAGKGMEDAEPEGSYR